MEFIEIDRIEPFLAAINGRDEFIHVVKDGYQIIDYVYEGNDSFSDPYRRECRGIKFDLEGRIIARPFHKFFNYGQKLINYDWSKPHVAMTKLDGSMVHTALVNGQVRLMTRMGITDQALMAEKNAYFLQFVDSPIANYARDYTFIFEFTSPENRIVIEYDKAELTLLAVRHTRGGYYLPRWMVKDFATLLFCNPVEVHNISLNDDNIEQVRQETTGIEGFVVAWNDGTYVKIKTDEYVSMHHAVSFFDREDMVLNAVLNNQADDLYPLLSDDRMLRLREFEASTLEDVKSWIKKITRKIKSVKNKNTSRKDFALWVNAKIPQGMRSAYFCALDGKDIRDSVNQCLMKHPDLLTKRW